MTRGDDRLDAETATKASGALHRRAWYALLLAGTVPLLLAGFVAAALANRVAFVAWGLMLAALHALALRHVAGAEDGRRRRARAERGLVAVWAGAAVSYLALAAVYAEPMERGARAHAPPVVAFLFDAPWPVTGVLILLGVGFLLYFRAAARR